MCTVLIPAREEGEVRMCERNNMETPWSGEKEGRRYSRCRAEIPLQAVRRAW